MLSYMLRAVTITYRPKVLEYTLKQFTEIVVNDKVTEYFTCAESASEDEDEPTNHYHAYIMTTQHQDAVRKRLIKELNSKKPALVVGKHSDPKYLLGYVQKEGGKHRTNIDDEDRLRDSLDYYLELHDVVEENGGHDLTADDVYRMLLKLHKDALATEFNYIMYSDFIKKYDAHLKFSTYSKINLKSLKARINIMLGHIELI